MKELILKRLYNNIDFISGSELAKEFSVSRTTISNIVKELINDGWEIEAVSSKGYRIVTKKDIISKGIIEEYIDKKGFDCNVVYHKLIDSTNKWSKENIETLPHGTLVIAEEQTAARGRLGRKFFAPKESGIYMSLIVKNNFNIDDGALITCAAAVAVKRGLEKICHVSPKIKWVNDIFIDDKKVCGILTEGITNMETKSIDNVIIGIGINLTTENFPDEIKEIAGSIIKNGEICFRNIVIGEIISELFTLINNFKDKSFMNEYILSSNIIGEEVVVTKWDTQIFGTAIDIDLDGNLVVEKINGEIEKFNSGEVSAKKIKR